MLATCVTNVVFLFGSSELFAELGFGKDQIFGFVKMLYLECLGVGTFLHILLLALILYSW